MDNDIGQWYLCTLSIRPEQISFSSGEGVTQTHWDKAPTLSDYECRCRLFSIRHVGWIVRFILIGHHFIIIICGGLSLHQEEEFTIIWE